MPVPNRRTTAAIAAGMITLAAPGCSPADVEASGDDVAARPWPGLLADAPALVVPDDAWIVLPDVDAATAVTATSSGWAVLDAGNSALHLLDPEGRAVRSVGGEGDGPGELQGPQELATAPDGFRVGSVPARIDLFNHDGVFLDRIELAVPDCLPLRLDGLASGPQTIAVVRCGLGRDATFRLLSYTMEGATEELGRRPVSPDGSLGLTAAVVSVGDGPAVWGTTDDRCFTGPGAVRPVCFQDGAEVPIPESERKDMERTLGSAARAAGFRFHVPEVYPLVSDVWWTRAGAFANRLADDERSYLERQVDGARWKVPPEVLVWPGDETLLAVRYTLEGTLVAVLPLPDTGPEPETGVDGR